MKEFWLCFVPLFVAVDPIGMLPIFLSLTNGIDKPVLGRIIRQSVITAAIVSLVFLAVGTGMLRLLGITMADFMVAGGVVLFIISVNDIVSSEQVRRQVDVDSLGAVPLGVPLIAGPAVLTMSLLLRDQYGMLLTGSCLVVNILLTGVSFTFADAIHRFLGKAGAKTISKLSSLLLAAIAVMIVRSGIFLLVPRLAR